MAPAELRPWHYHDPFFQEPPAVYEADLDQPFVDADIQRICREFYAGIGLPIDDVLARSDLYEKRGKSPHAFCTDIDRAGDVRVLAQHPPHRVLDEHDAARAGALGLFAARTFRPSCPGPSAATPTSCAPKASP